MKGLSLNGLSLGMVATPGRSDRYTVAQLQPYLAITTLLCPCATSCMEGQGEASARGVKWHWKEAFPYPGGYHAALHVT